ncbi:importin 11 [Apiospora phragmitis]|uniref:Importin 11 n=1 Tax=Apiospora phragmitis TaxID=2905665 RepID=A0ABR1V136_9PEZI
MSFSIEVAGQASPLSLQELWRTLQSATSQDYSQRQSAGQQLTTWEVHEEYYPALQMVFLERTLPHEIRLLAIIQLKNGIDKYWRHHTLKNAIQPAKKDLIRSKLFSGTVGEPDKQLALHNALVTAKIIRIDYPQAWPEALPNLISLLRETKDGNQAELAGALLVLLRTVKELGTARLRKSQTALQSVTPELVFVLGEIYSNTSTLWMSAVDSGRIQEEEAGMAIHNSLVAFKALRRLLVVGYEYPHKDNTVKAAWDLPREQFVKLVGYSSQEDKLPQPILDMIGKHLMQFAKLHVEMATEHPASFASLPNSFDLVQTYWTLVVEFAQVFNTSEGLRQGSSSVGAGHKSKVEGPLLERLALKGLLLVRSCVKMVNSPQQTFKYRSQETREEQAALILSVKQGLLTDDLVVKIAHLIISRLLIFRKADIEAWEEEPEEWEQQEEAQGAAWEWEVRPCAEQLLQQLITHYKQLLMEPLLAYFATLQDPQLENMVREAVYNTIGLAAAHVEKHFSFDELLRSTIPVDAQQTGPNCKILRRRIGILISQWVPVHIAPASRPLIYQIYRHLLRHDPDDPNNDLVVRITAARQFKWVADDFSFSGEEFHPYAGDILKQLLQLLGEVEVDETKLAILNTTKVIIERMETHVTSFADLIMSALPSIWASAGDLGFMMKQAVLTILQSLVMSMKTESQRYHHIILPLIAEAVQEGSDVYVYLIDEALELWTNVLLQTSPPLPQELLGLLPHAIRHLEAHTEHHMSNLAITGSYITLAPEAVLGDQHRQALLKGLAATYTATNREQSALARKYNETLIRCANELGGTDGLKLICQDLAETGFLKFMLEGIHDAYEARQTLGPKGRQPRVSNLTLTDYFSILSRIALADPAIFAELVASLGSLEQVWPWLSAEWFYSFDCMADTLRQKLNLLALTRLVELGQPMQELLLGQLQDFFTMWTGVFAQVMDEENPKLDATIMTAPVEATEWDTPKDVRERALLASDPVRNVNCLDFVRSSLDSLVQRAGGGASFQENYLVNVDADVLNSFTRATGFGS